MCQENARACVGGSVLQCRHWVALLRRIEVMRAVVGHAGHYELRTVVLDDYVFVHQHTQPESLELRGPRALTRVIFMIARYEVCAVARIEPGERLRMICEIAHGTVD